MSAESSDQEEEEVEEVMEADIVSLTLDPPPANAAAVLHQQLHHHHGHHHGPNVIHGQNVTDVSGSNTPNAYHETKKTEVRDNNEKIITDNGVLNYKYDALIHSNITPQTDSSCRPNFYFDQNSTTGDSTNLENEIPSYISDVTASSVNYNIPSAVRQSLKSEVLPKKSSFPCLKSKNSDDANRRSKKAVTFPDGEAIVSMRVEPMNPWQDAKVATSAEVILEYRKMCKQNKTKPIDNVMRQLQDLPDLSSRIATLSLKGFKLDNKACESLEAIFRRIQFEVIDFENCGLEEEGATALLEMIEFYQSACKLNVAMNPKMGIRGWQTLCRMLRKTPCMLSLDARRTMLTSQTMPMFGRCLKADPYLRTLHLEGVCLTGRPLLILTTALKYNTLLEELYLGDNELQAPDGVSIGAMLSANKTLQLLDLRNNGFRDGGLVHIANGLVDQSNSDSGGLASIVLWNLGLTHEGMYGFCNALAKTKTLRSLNLGQNRLGDLGIQKIKPGLIRNRSLRKLGLLNTRIGNEGAVALAEILADSISLTRIDVRENHIQIAGLMAVSLALKVNRSLVRIDLDKELRREPGLETVQQSVLADIYNYCHRNKQVARESISRESSTSEDGDSLVGQEFSEKESDDDRVESPNDSFEDFSRNGKFLSTLQSLAGREAQRKEAIRQDSDASVEEGRKPSAKEQLLNSVLPKRRFKVTKINESRGHSSSSIVSRIANVLNDSSAETEKPVPGKADSGNPSDSPAEDDGKELPWKGLQRQANVESPTPANAEKVSSPVRSRNTELKEFYRRLKDGDINPAEYCLTDKIEASNDRKVDNHIDKLPFPGKAQKLNDVIKDKFDIEELNVEGGDNGQMDPLGACSYTYSQNEISTVPVSIE